MIRDVSVRGWSSNVRQRYIGARVNRVAYRIGSGQPSSQSEGAAAASVDQGLVISTSAGDLDVAWCIDGYLEFLQVEVDASLSPALNVRDLVDVSAAPGWRNIVGNTIVGFGPAFFSGGYELQCLWALRINFASDERVVIALGDCDGGKISYQPDNIVAIFDPALAKGYSIGENAGSSWGEDLK